MLSNASVQNSSPENKDEVKSSHGEPSQHLGANAGEDFTSQKAKQQGVDKDSALQDFKQNMECRDKREKDNLASSDLRTESDLTEQISVPETSGVQVIGDVSSGWKIVMHEESNSYYYWNTETGETSWEVPDVLAQETKLCDQKAPTIAGKTDDVSVGVEASNLISGVKVDGLFNSGTIEGDAIMVPHGIESYGHVSQMDEWNLGCNNGAIQDNMVNEDHESGIDIPSQVLQRFEALLERLKSLQGSKEQLQGVDWIPKYTLEVEIRLIDIKSLLSYGSSLLPFWMHSDRQLKQLESAIDDEMSKIIKPVQLSEVEENHPSFVQGEKDLQESTGCKSEADRVGTLDDCHVTPRVDTLEIVSKDQNIRSLGVSAEHASACGSPTRHMETGASEQVNGVVVPNESTTENEFYTGEEVDMDVDMEVEESNSTRNTTVAYELNPEEFAPPEQPIHPCPPSVYTSLATEDMLSVPPPPDEEWIPPPPPDNEQIPPPPPDDPPPEPLCPPLPSYPETGQPPYTEQYNYSYPASSFEYYGHTVTEAPNTNYYGHPEGCHVAIPHGPLYYGAVPTTYTETAQVVANPVEPVTYYGLQDGTGTAAVAPHSYENLASGQTATINSLSGAGSTDSLQNVNLESIEAGEGSVEVPSTQATIQAPAVPSANSVPTASIPATSVVTKVHSKAPRAKKRTAVASSLRSNKKVSSLVDKWKAAKEELLEDEEDEPENAYELFEKKRQRGIEEWYAQQIRSGEAKDNANFQPLGGDWREKVKRRKTQLAREAAQSTASPISETPTDGNQKLDLTALSKDLPSGWQAYWDESSKQVYYGNTVTSETTWTKPTK